MFCSLVDATMGVKRSRLVRRQSARLSSEVVPADAQIFAPSNSLAPFKPSDLRTRKALALVDIDDRKIELQL